jgi:hypothetical protein
LRLVGIIFAVVLACVIVTFLYDFEINQATPFARFDPASAAHDKSIPTARMALSVAMMILGILAGAFNSTIAGKSEVLHLRQEVVSTFRSARFIKSMIAAPIVFSAVYLATKDQPDWVLASIFAFQNGFFCDSVLRSREQQPRSLSAEQQET